MVTFNSGYFSVIVLCINLLCVLAVGVLWMLDRNRKEKERKILWEDNKRMCQKLHKTKEIFPALQLVLERLKSEKNIVEFDNLLVEVHQLCQEQMEENKLDAMRCKSYPSTGIGILDGQIQWFGKEAAKKNTQFDVFINDSLRTVLKKENIKEIELLRLIGDLIRNAFDAIAKRGKQEGHILLIMGCMAEIFRIEVYDNGVRFPIGILNEFGKRGNTEGGTGNGIADILIVLEKYRATYKLIEYKKNYGFTKGISIIWNQKNERLVETYRSSKISNSSMLKKVI